MTTKKPTFDEIMDKQKECVASAVHKYVQSSVIAQLKDESQHKFVHNYVDTLFPWFGQPSKNNDPRELVFYGKPDSYLNGKNGYQETKKEARQKVLNNLNTGGFRGGQLHEDIKAFKKIDQRAGDHCLKPSFIVRREARWGLKVKRNYVITYRKPLTVKSAAKGCTGRYFKLGTLKKTNELTMF